MILDVWLYWVTLEGARLLELHSTVSVASGMSHHELDGMMAKKKKALYKQTALDKEASIIRKASIICKSIKIGRQS